MHFSHSTKLVLAFLLAIAPTPQVQSHEQRDLVPFIALAGALSCTALSCLAYYVYFKVSNKEDIIDQNDSNDFYQDTDDLHNTKNNAKHSSSDIITGTNSQQESVFITALKQHNVQEIKKLLQTTQPQLQDGILMLENQDLPCSVDLFLALLNNQTTYPLFCDYLKNNVAKFTNTYDNIVIAEHSTVKQKITALLKRILINKTIKTADNLFIYAMENADLIAAFSTIDTIQQEIFLYIYGIPCTSSDYNNILFTELQKTAPDIPKLTTLIQNLTKTKDWDTNNTELLPIKTILIIDGLWNNEKIQVFINTQEGNKLKSILQELIKKELPEEYDYIFGDPLTVCYKKTQKKILQVLETYRQSPWHTTILASTKAAWNKACIYYSQWYSPKKPNLRSMPQPPQQHNKKYNPSSYHIKLKKN